MGIYGIATRPIIEKLKQIGEVRQGVGRGTAGGNENDGGRDVEVGGRDEEVIDNEEEEEVDRVSCSPMYSSST